jgi:hypothetical protein
LLKGHTHTHGPFPCGAILCLFLFVSFLGYRNWISGTSQSSLSTSFLGKYFEPFSNGTILKEFSEWFDGGKVFFGREIN